jgi:hypothetical protein
MIHAQVWTTTAAEDSEVFETPLCKHPFIAAPGLLRSLQQNMPDEGDLCPDCVGMIEAGLETSGPGWPD